MIGKVGDNAVILLAAILTACGVALLFLPWQALSLHANPTPAPAVQSQQNGEVVVGIGKPATPQKPHKP